MLHVCSDHAPILLDCGCFLGDKRPFFENIWLQAEGFMDKVRSWWASYQFHGTPSFIRAKKLQSLKSDIKRWNVQEFSNVGAYIKVCTDEPSVLDRVKEERGLSDEEMERKRVITRELETSRIHWLKEGDKCTKFFHRIANAHKRHNSIKS
jgi:hypothetical protein